RPRRPPGALQRPPQGGQRVGGAVLLVGQRCQAGQRPGVVALELVPGRQPVGGGGRLAAAVGQLRQPVVDGAAVGGQPQGQPGDGVGHLQAVVGLLAARVGQQRGFGRGGVAGAGGG